MEQLEKVYLGATLLRARFPDVSQISKKVLDAFFHMRGDLPTRTLRQFVASFTYIQYGKVYYANMPPQHWCEDVGFDRSEFAPGSEPENWSQLEPRPAFHRISAKDWEDFAPTGLVDSAFAAQGRAAVPIAARHSRNQNGEEVGLDRVQSRVFMTFALTPVAIGPRLEDDPGEDHRLARLALDRFREWDCPTTAAWAHTAGKI